MGLWAVTSEGQGQGAPERMPRSVMKYTPQELLQAARLTVSPAGLPLTIAAKLDPNDPSDHVGIACFFAMCAELAIARLPIGPERETVVCAHEYAEEEIKLDLVRLVNPEYTPRG